MHARARTHTHTHTHTHTDSEWLRLLWLNCKGSGINITLADDLWLLVSMFYMYIWRISAGNRKLQVTGQGYILIYNWGVNNIYHHDVTLSNRHLNLHVWGQVKARTVYTWIWKITTWSVTFALLWIALFSSFTTLKTVLKAICIKLSPLLIGFLRVP